MSKLYKVKIDNAIYEVEVELISETESTENNISKNNIEPAKPQDKSTSGVQILAPIQGTIIEIMTPSGAQVKAGDVILTLEAMKMVNNIVAPSDGTVISINVSSGADVLLGDVLAVIG